MFPHGYQFENEISLFCVCVRVFIYLLQSPVKGWSFEAAEAVESLSLLQMYLLPYFKLFS